MLQLWQLTVWLLNMNKPKIIAYLKPTCGWSQGVRAVFEKYRLAYEDRDIANDPSNHSEMVQRSGQAFSPCVEIDGHMLPDVSGADVEVYLLAEGLVKPTERETDAPTNRGCAEHSGD